MKPSANFTILLAVSGMITITGLHAAPKDDATKPTAIKENKTQPPKAGISPEKLAKLKNVPASMKNAQGEFTLVAVIEGEDSNAKLTQSLKVVGAQRQRLAKLTQQFEQTSTNLPQQRELLATQINEIRKTLQTNLQFMAKNFAYSLNYHYLMVPHEASLVSVTQKDGKPITNVVYEFKNTKTYDDCQSKRASYRQLKQAQVKKAQGDKKTTPTNPAPKITLTPEMKKAQKELIKLYKYDPEKNYQVNFKKTAIYARQAK